MINLAFLQNGTIRKVRKNAIIKNVAYLTQIIGGTLVTIQLSPPRNLKITNKAAKKKLYSDIESNKKGEPR